MYRYFAWKEGDGYWKGGKLLSFSQITTLRKHLPENYEQFETVQAYSANGTALQCPIYADFDHKTNLALARKDAQIFTNAIQRELNVTPNIFFSGSKGFHVIVPYELKHPRCHIVAQKIIAEISPPMKHLDMSVYRTKAMLRIPNSPASKPGRFKVQISVSQLFNESEKNIIDFSAYPVLNHLSEYDSGKINEEYLHDLYTKITSNLPTLKDTDNRFSTPITHCIKHIFENPVDEGGRNRSIFILAKYFKAAGKTYDEALELMLGQDHFAQWEKDKTSKVTPVLSSVFRSNRNPHIGCKSGADGELLRTYCDDMCVFSDKFPELNIRGTNESSTRKKTP